MRIEKGAQAMVGSWGAQAHGRAVRIWIAIGAIGLTALAFAGTATAAGEFEPNDGRETAYGPLLGGKDYTATFETNNDVDWYVFYLKSYSQMDFSATTVSSGCGGVAHIELRDKDGTQIETFHAGEKNEVNHLLITLAAGRYYFEVSNDGCVGDVYRFRLEPATAITGNRECGEAIVARDAVGPLLAEATAKVSKNTEKLVQKVEAMRKAKRVYKRLKHRRNASRYEKRQALTRLERAKAAREKAFQAQAGLEAIAAQHQGELSAAEAQIAAHC